jgi:hypothetical protein
MLWLAATCLAQEAAVDQFLDQWHQAAAEANSTAFFDAMADSSVYIGTDASERWSKTEFMAFAKPYFDKGKAWDFKAFDRDVHFSADRQYVWFSELLNTWMGVCRGSGVLHRKKGVWRITQYHLSVTVPNEAIRDFITLIDHFNKQKK